MKTLKTFLSIAVVAALTVFSSCGEDEPGLSFDEIVAGTWSLSSVTVDGSDVTSDFSGFSLSLNHNGPNSGSGSYSTNNGGSLLTSGEYYADGTKIYTMNESSGMTSYSITSFSLTNDNKTLTFGFNNPTTTLGGGRTEGLAGDYVFVFTK